DLPGIYTVVTKATDADGLIGTAQTEILVRDAADRTPPTVTLANAGVSGLVNAPLPVTGSVDDTNLNSWQLTMTPVNGGTSVLLASSRQVAGTGTLLGTVDPGNFENGAYLLTLSATDISGRTSTSQRLLEIDTATKAGAYTRLETDFTATLSGISIPL